MSEITFAKSFLATLDKKPIKLAADHISDPRQYPNQSPATLPRATHPYPRKTGPTSTQSAQSKTLTVSLKPMRTGEVVTLPSVMLDTTIHEIKTQYAAKAGLQQDKIKLLLNKKPAGDLKTLKDLGVEGENVELSVMLMAGASTSSAAATPREQSPAAVMPSTPLSDPMDIDPKTSAPESEKAAAEVQSVESSVAKELKGEEFWADLKGFLSQRLRDEKEGERLVGLFRGSLQ